MARLPKQQARMKKRRIVKAHIKGKTHKEIAKVEYPDATPTSGEVMVSRQLATAEAKELLARGKAEAIRSAGLTWEKAIQPVVDGLTANKPVVIEGEILDSGVADMGVRLKASSMATSLLKDEDVERPTSPAISEAIDGDINEVELTKLVFRKNENNEPKEPNN